MGPGAPAAFRGILRAPMPEPPAPRRPQAAALFAFAVAAIAFGSPARLLWLRVEAGWLAPFAVWLGVIALVGVAGRRP